jgi:hypothetical protein
MMFLDRGILVFILTQHYKMVGHKSRPFYSVVVNLSIIANRDKQSLA